MMNETMASGTAYLEQAIVPNGEYEKALAVLSVARVATNTQEFFEFMAMLGLDDDADMIEQAMELRLSKDAPGPSDISSPMI